MFESINVVKECRHVNKWNLEFKILAVKSTRVLHLKQNRNLKKQKFDKKLKQKFKRNLHEFYRNLKGN